MRINRTQLAGLAVLLIAAVVVILRPTSATAEFNTTVASPLAGTSSQAEFEYQETSAPEEDDPQEMTGDDLAEAFPDLLILTEDEANALPAPDEGDRLATDLPPGELAG